MKKRHLVLHSLMLGILNLMAVMVAFFLWKLLGGPQRNIQGLLSILIAFAGFWLWLKFATSRGITLAQGKWEALGFWLLSCLIPIAIFVPLHYFTQGYLSSWRNIEALIGLIIPVNFAAA
ncbi:hypothetical protein H8E52_03750, partial [bacterium]|nr:hypothetical protein [bacterium]